MPLNAKAVRRYDIWLLTITVAVVALFLLLAQSLSPLVHQNERVQNVRYAEDTRDRWDITSKSQIAELPWQKVENPVNLGMNQVNYWFTFTVSPTPSSLGTYLLEIAYPLLDDVTVSFYSAQQDAPIATFTGGDSKTFSARHILHPSLLFSAPASNEPLTVVIKAKTSGSLKLPIRLWEEKEFIEYTALHNVLMGLFFGFLVAMGISNLFIFLTTHKHTFLVYAGYVFSLTLTLASINGLAYAHLWPDQIWFQERAVAVFANAGIMFAVIFSHGLLEVGKHSPLMGRVLKLFSWLFFGNILICLLLPYAYLIKLFLLLLGVVVLITFSLGIWLAIKGIVIARYYSFAWAILLFSGFTVSLDYLGVVILPVPSNYLLMLGAVVETLLLALVLAISYSHNREAMFDAKESALAQEKAALLAKQDLLAVQQKYQDKLEYQVQERTLELEVALRELSQANQELENLNTIDSLTGIRNRRYFDKRLVAEGRRSRREQTPLSVAMIDVDYFKTINDTYGHAAGDACICHVANQLVNMLRRSADDVCRYGGEEFGIILPNTDVEGAKGVLEQMREQIARTPVEIDDKAIYLAISAGVSTTVVAREDHELALLKHADAMLYGAKDAGRNRVFAEELPG
ncbi:diguanylate cyclase [Alteromonas pelagimontana]|uniref:diguanylate cyclase n=1 Tax=Alteromonas pelagimontana TaxID=1858656 RepID=A0A6M4MBV0_9ALTE|nr:diguanylate cyclase [Alteromonas pelagimontana]QJR80507.1 diguanylate cyclase [Alteromonas pelagimontana]